MKYNRAEIMRNAWRAYNFEKMERNNRGLSMNKTFSYFLKMAWMGARNAVKAAEREAREAAELVELANNKQKFTGKVSFEGYFFNLWEGHGKRRIYIGNNGAYIDICDNNSIHAKKEATIKVAKRFIAAFEF